MTQQNSSGRESQSAPRWRLLREYRVEIAWFFVVIIGLFLLFERLSIRSTLIHWLRSSLTTVMGIAGRLDDAMGAFLASLTVSVVIGTVLLIAAVVGILARVRWRLLRSRSLTTVRCPVCKGELHRIHRSGFDRALSRFVPVRRYRCASPTCRWSGLRVHVSTGQHHSKSSSR